MEKYTKPALTFKEQVDLLKSRGLVISDQAKAEKFLAQINYYRFSGYCLHFEESRHKFKAGTTFDEICNLYELDRRLRFLIDEALEVIESFIRTSISYHMVHRYGAFVHERPSLLE